MSAATLRAADVAAEPIQYLTFLLGSEVFAIGILAIKEIIEYGGVTAVPMMPECIRGVINLRGAVVPVMDLALRFGKPSNAVTKRTCIVIVETNNSDSGNEHVGVAVDAVNAVIDIEAGDIEPPPAFGTRIHADFIHGLGKVNGKFVIVLDVQRVLDVKEFNDAVAAVDGNCVPPAKLEKE
ncbi:MAG: chemotaxis protein CheW [Steroidobacteraceae bacterium]